MSCPDGCAPQPCTHFGEPLNAKGKRERLSGPESTKPGNVAYAANFGGLVRMLKTSKPHAKTIFRNYRKNLQSAHEYINFVHRNLPNEEANQYTIAEWRKFAETLGIDLVPDRLLLRNAISESFVDYQDMLRDNFPS